MFYHLFHRLQPKLRCDQLNYYTRILYDLINELNVPDNEMVNFGMNAISLFHDLFNEGEFLPIRLGKYFEKLENINFKHFVQFINMYEVSFNLPVTVNNNEGYNDEVFNGKKKVKMISKGTDGSVYKISNDKCIKISNVYDEKLTLLSYEDINEFIISRLAGNINSVNFVNGIECKTNGLINMIYLEMPIFETVSIHNKMHNKEIIIQILHALACLHHNDIIHNDYSCRNLLCIKLPEPKKIEFKLLDKSIIVETEYLIKVIDFNRSSTNIMKYTDYSYNNFDVDLLYFCWSSLKYIKLNHPIISYIFSDVDAFVDCDDFIKTYPKIYDRARVSRKVIFDVLNDNYVLSHFDIIYKDNNVVESCFT